MTTRSLPSRSGRPPGWFANRSLITKFGILLSAVVISCGGVFAAMLVGDARVSGANQELSTLNKAEKLVLQLDTRASELKVDGYKAAVRPDATAELAELKDDIATPTGMIAALDKLHLTGKPAAAVAVLEDKYGQYIQAISVYIDAAVKDQITARADWQQIQKANDISDAAVGNAEDTLAAASSAQEQVLARAISTARTVSLGIGLLGLLVIGAVSVLTIRSITRPVGKVKASLEALAEGDLTRAVDWPSRDEMGQMATALDTARASLREVLEVVTTSAGAVASSSEELSASATQIAASAEETSAQSGVVSGAAEEVSRSVQTVAAGAEQMGASIREIASNAAEASQVANKAVTAAASTTATVAKLGDSSAEIGNVVKVITSIAEQTNLLALNATIEAARAGEAGKGFAVVANEVKELAQETAKATEDIAQRVQAIQGDTAAAVTAIGEISEIVAQISDRQATIASAVEEQTATTQEMSRSITEAAGGSGQIAENITNVSSAAEATTQALTTTRTAVDELSRMSADLRSTVSRFTY